MSKVILVCGEQGSGKTTYIQNEMDKVNVHHSSVHLVARSQKCIKRALKSESKSVIFLESNNIDPTELSDKVFDKIEVVYCCIKHGYFDKTGIFRVIEKDYDLPF